MGPDPAQPLQRTKTSLQVRLPLTYFFCLQKPPSVDPRPSLLCGTLNLSDDGTAWSEVWAAIPESDPQVLDLLAGSQVSVPVLVHAQGCESLKLEVPIVGLDHFLDPLQPCDLALTSSNVQSNPGSHSWKTGPCNVYKTARVRPGIGREHRGWALLPTHSHPFTSSFIPTS